jgi:hypothetical protein
VTIPSNVVPMYRSSKLPSVIITSFQSFPLV